MNEQEIIIEVTSLDGRWIAVDWSHPFDCGYSLTGHIHNCTCEIPKYLDDGIRVVVDRSGNFTGNHKSYTTSRDAIVPVLTKVLWGDVIIYQKFEEALRKGWGVVNATQALTVLTPANICEALLRATGKWKD